MVCNLFTWRCPLAVAPSKNHTKQLARQQNHPKTESCKNLSKLQGVRVSCRVVSLCLSCRRFCVVSCHLSLSCHLCVSCRVMVFFVSCRVVSAWGNNPRGCRPPGYRPPGRRAPGCRPPGRRLPLARLPAAARPADARPAAFLIRRTQHLHNSTRLPS